MMSDARILHNYWMDMLYKRHTDPHPVVGKYRPEEKIELAVYHIWSVIGIGFVMLAYPISYVGILTKIYCVDKVTGFVESHGIVKSLILLGVLWTTLSGLSYLFQPTETTYAVVASSVVAMVSAIVSYLCYVTGDNRIKVALGYPAAYTAILLPPVVFSVLSPIFGESILELTTDIAVYLQNTVAKPIGLRQFFSDNFDLVGISYVILWLNFSFVLGWITGIPVQLAKIIRDT